MTLCTDDDYYDTTLTRSGRRRYIVGTAVVIPWLPAGTYLPTTLVVYLRAASVCDGRSPAFSRARCVSEPSGLSEPTHGPRPVGPEQRPGRLFFSNASCTRCTVHTSATIHGNDNNIIFIIIRRTHNL